MQVLKSLSNPPQLFIFFSAFFHFTYQHFKSMRTLILCVKWQWVQLSLCLFQLKKCLCLDKTNLVYYTYYFLLYVLTSCLSAWVCTKYTQLYYSQWFLIVHGLYVDCILIYVQRYKAYDVGWVSVCDWWERIREIFQWNTPVTDGYSTPHYCIWHWWHSSVLWRTKIFQICFLGELQRPTWLNWPQNILHLWSEAGQYKYWIGALFDILKNLPFLCKVDHDHAVHLDCTGWKIDVTDLGNMQIELARVGMKWEEEGCYVEVEGITY